MVRRIIVFRFDRNPLVCRERVRLLRRLNPGVRVVGLYGGARGVRGAAFRAGNRPVLGLDGFWTSPEDGGWNWKNGDLALAAWYRSVGFRFDFDVAHLVEWDLLLAAPLADVYGHVEPDVLGLTTCTPLAEIPAGWIWMTRPDLRRETEDLFRLARDRWAYDGEPRACLGVGPCFPRRFLEDYAELGAPEVGHDELRLPLFADILGYPVVDNGFRRAWANKDDDVYFNASGRPIDNADIAAEMGRPDGRRVFHPVRGRLPQACTRLANPR